MLEAGTILQNRYRIEKQIGHGGMGAVYVATDERFASRVAIKETFFNDENYGKAFEREARLLNNLRHPALPKVSDHFIEENGQFLVMEYIDGDDLSEKMQETKIAFPIKDVLNWADQLLDALDFLHTQEMPVIHRDIKPQNLKLTSRGQIILLDFGLAKGNPTDASHKTAAHSVFGYSKNYASLEQMQGTGTDPRSDLYSLGATLYHLMTGSAPIDALTRAMTVLNGDTDPLKSANLLHNQVPVSVAEVLLRAMALNANHRPSSAMAMRTMLAEAANNVSGEYDTASGKKGVSGLLTQETELIENGQSARDTEQTALLTARKLGAELDAKTIKKLNEQKAATNPNSTYGFSSAGTFNQQGKPKNGLLIGAALGGLLMAGTAAGIYFVKPDLFQQSTQTVNSVAENPSAQNSANISAVENPAVISVNANSFTNANAIVEAAKKESAEKNAKTSAQVSSNDKKVAQPQTPQPPKTPAVKEKEMGEDDVKINGERIETRDVIVDNGRVIFKNPNSRPRVQDGRPPLSNEQIRKLPPAERQRIRRILRRNIQIENLDDDDN
jgi:serine/threonine protein kinase